MFHEDIDDSIFRQVNTETGSTLFQNIEEVENWGVELAGNTAGLWLEDLDFSANVAYTNAEIKKNSGFPISEGKTVPRVPEWRVNFFGTYHVSNAMDWSVGMRFADEQFNDLDNRDGARGGPRFADGYLLFDTKLTWRIGKGFTASFGVDNLTDDEYYISHTYPGRIFFSDLKWKF